MLVIGDVGQLMMSAVIEVVCSRISLMQPNIPIICWCIIVGVHMLDHMVQQPSQFLADFADCKIQVDNIQDGLVYYIILSFMSILSMLLSYLAYHFMKKWA
uniref:Uncharacterized protein n=1 Tax=Schizaphis graminum TaxID=13262 RepID=A0A2S2PPI8_SCHGA